MIKSVYIKWQEARLRDLEAMAELTLERARHGDWACLADHILAGG